MTQDFVEITKNFIHKKSNFWRYIKIGGISAGVGVLAFLGAAYAIPTLIASESFAFLIGFESAVVVGTGGGTGLIGGVTTYLCTDSAG